MYPLNFFIFIFILFFSVTDIINSIIFTQYYTSDFFYAFIHPIKVYLYFMCTYTHKK